MELNRKQQIMYNEISNIISNNNGSSLNNRIFDYVNNLHSQLEQKEKQLNDIKEYIKKHSKDSELTIYGLPDCKVFMGSLEDLLSIIERDNYESKK